MSGPPACQAMRDEFQGWHAIHLTNGVVRVVAVPDLGGRLMAYDLDRHPYLFFDRHLAGKLFSAAENQGDGSLAAWKNYGGDKTWPAPQGWDGPDQWPGPPDPILDTGRYEVAELIATPDEARVRMVSPTGSPTGVRITREVSLRADSSRVALRLSFTNISDRWIRWSIWDVVQLDAAQVGPSFLLTWDPHCVITAPVNPRSRFSKGYTVMFGAEDNPQWRVDPQTGLFVGTYKFEIGKVGLDSRAGWIAFANTRTGHAFAARFPVDPKGEYPDGGADIECWTVGRGQVASLAYNEDDGPFLMEAEVLSPLRDIAPGATTSFDIEWAACRCSAPIVDVTEGGCISQPMSLRRYGAWAKLTAVFGVFDVGQVEFVWLDDHGAPVAAQSFGTALPANLVWLDQEVERRADAAQGRLELVTLDNRRRFLASAPLI